MIRRGTYKLSAEDRRWEYEPVTDLWTDVDPGINYSNGGSSDEVIKYQENHDDQEQEKVVSAPLNNPRRLR